MLTDTERYLRAKARTFPQGFPQDKPVGNHVEKQGGNGWTVGSKRENYIFTIFFHATRKQL